MAGRSQPATGWSDLPAPLRAALATAVVGGALLAVGPLSPMVRPDTPAGFESRPLLFVLGLVPAGVAVGFALRGRSSAVAGALKAAALIAPGQLVMDAQLAVNGSLAERPELALPTTLAALHGGPGAWLLLLGSALTIVAGLFAVGQGIDRSRVDQGRLDQGRVDHSGADRGTIDPARVVAEPNRPGNRQGSLVAGLCLGAAAALGLISAPFSSSDVFLLAPDTLDAPTLVVAGGLLIAVAVLAAAVIGAGTTDGGAARGWLLGTSAMVVTLALPRIVSGLAVRGLSPAWGPYLALVAAIGLAVLAAFAGRTVHEPGAVEATEPAEVTLPGQHRLQLFTGVFGLAAALLALGGAFAPLFSGMPALPADFPQPDAAAGRLLLPAAVLVGVLSVALFVPRWAATVRPALALGWVAIPLTAASAIDAALSAAAIDGVTLDSGAWLISLAVLAALAAGACAGLAGGVERDDVDITQVPLQRWLVPPAVLAVLLSFGAFGLPVLRGNYLVAALWSDFRVASWGLVLALLAVAGAAALAPFCRPARGAALLLGAAGVALVRFLELPLTRSHDAAVGAADGAWWAVACAVILVIGAGVAGWAARRSAGR
ncbi:MAG TPA: hypothetical protein VF444_19445 [Pseudonocardiaceae bacterium]